MSSSALALFAAWLPSYMVAQGAPVEVLYPPPRLAPSPTRGRVILAPAPGRFGPPGVGAGAMDQTAKMARACGVAITADGRDTRPGATDAHHVEAAEEALRLVLVGMAVWALDAGYRWTPSDCAITAYQLPRETGDGCRIFASAIIGEAWREGSWTASEIHGTTADIAGEGTLSLLDGTTVVDTATIETEVT